MGHGRFDYSNSMYSDPIAHQDVVPNTDVRGFVGTDQYPYNGMY